MDSNILASALGMSIKKNVIKSKQEFMTDEELALYKNNIKRSKSFIKK